jgi:hypothetical protein
VRCRHSPSSACSFGENLGHDRGRRLAGGLCSPRPPIQAAQLVDEHNARDLAEISNRHFERIAFDPARDGANEGEPYPVVETRQREDQRRPPSSLPASGLWRE